MQIRPQKQKSLIMELIRGVGRFAPGRAQVDANLDRARGLRADDLMTPRSLAVAYDQRRAVADLDGHVAHLDRFVVFDGDLDVVTGQVLTQDLAGTDAATLAELSRPIASVPRGTPVVELMRTMVQVRQNMLRVEDGDGRTVGFVHIGDVVAALTNIAVASGPEAPAPQRAPTPVHALVPAE